MVGLGRFELPTSPLSGVRSNQLSYRPAINYSFNFNYVNNSFFIYLKQLVVSARKSLKGGDPAPPSGRATLLRLYPSHESHRGDRPL